MPPPPFAARARAALFLLASAARALDRRAPSLAAAIRARALASSPALRRRGRRRGRDQHGLLAAGGRLGQKVDVGHAGKRGRRLGVVVAAGQLGVVLLLLIIILILLVL